MSTYNPAGGQTYTLSGSISSTATSITLSSFTEPVTGTVYTMANLNTDIAYGTIAPKTTSAEFISFTGITANADGTATLTGVTRGLAKKYPFTSDAAYKLPHSGQSQFILSDAPQVFQKYVSIENDQTVAGIKTFSSTPVSSAGLPTNSDQLATKQYVDNTATGTTNINRIVVAGTAGETIAVDQLVYLKASDGRWWLADADSAASSENVILGIAQGAGTAGNAIASGVLTQGFNTFSALTLTANTKYYASNTAGGFSSTPGTQEVTLGESQTTTTFLFYPRNDQQITEDQQDALAGTSGTPSATNKYVTNDDTATAATADKIARRLAGGNITVVTESQGDSSTKAASTAYVDTAILGKVFAQPISLSISLSGATTTLTYSNFACSSSGLSTSEPFFGAIKASAGYTPYIYRFLKQADGSIIATHAVQMTGSGASYEAMIVVCGSYVYAFGYDGVGNLVKRFDKSNLGNATTITVSGTGFTRQTAWFSNDTDLWNVYTAGSAKKYTISGTTITSGADTSYTSIVTTNGTWSDGTYVYQFDVGGGATYKWAIAGGARTTGTTTVVNQNFINGIGNATSFGSIFKEQGNTATLLSVSTPTNLADISTGKIIPITTF